VAFFKSDEQKAADAAKKADERFWASPAGQAIQAFERGDEFFHVELPYAAIENKLGVSPNKFGAERRNFKRTDVLGSVEEAGWRLEHANWVYVQRGQNIDKKMVGSGMYANVTGEVVGIYLFRRDDDRQNRAGGPTEIKRI
jgi:hypothetical protein